MTSWLVGSMYAEASYNACPTAITRLDAFSRKGYKPTALLALHRDLRAHTFVAPRSVDEAHAAFSHITRMATCARRPWHRKLVRAAVRRFELRMLSRDEVAIGITKNAAAFEALEVALQTNQLRLVRRFARYAREIQLHVAAVYGRLRSMAVLLACVDISTLPAEFLFATFDKACTGGGSLSDKEATALFVAACVRSCESPFAPRHRGPRALCTPALSAGIAARIGLALRDLTKT